MKDDLLIMDRLYIFNIPRTVKYLVRSTHYYRSVSGWLSGSCVRLSHIWLWVRAVAGSYQRPS